jgi:TPR repeat protein
MNWTRCCAVSVGLLTFCALSAQAQANNEPPVVQPHKPGASKPAPKPATPKLADLLVSCDLACSFTFDGEAKGRMDADGSVKIKGVAGDHLVVATAEGSADRIVKQVSLDPAHQTLLRVELQPVRQTRLKAEQAEQQRQQQAVQPPAVHPPATQQPLLDSAIPGLEAYVSAQTADERKCLGGDAATCDAIAANYRNGHGVTTDKQRAAFYYATACQLKMADACNHLGDMYAMELHDTPNASRAYTQAVNLYQRECDGGNPSSCIYMGNIYNYEGSGIKDLELLRASYQHACDTDPFWCHDIAELYENGHGVEKNPAKAHQLYQRACQANNTTYCSK